MRKEEALDQKTSVFGFVNCYHSAVTQRRQHTYLHPSTDIAKLNFADMSFFFSSPQVKCPSLVIVRFYTRGPVIGN